MKIKKIFACSITVAAVILLGGCTTVQYQIGGNLSRYECDRLSYEEIEIEMSKILKQVEYLVEHPDIGINFNLLTDYDYSERNRLFKDAFGRLRQLQDLKAQKKFPFSGKAETEKDVNRPSTDIRIVY
ncbi:MAG: hypothetical protein LBD40_03770 [Puniceicoccales bacterium]|jgi:hypothetical protein|nr:hypothetical protein [Puniceicoccales bacterium]